MNIDPIKYDTVTLEKMKYAIITKLSHDFAIPAQVDWSMEASFLTDDLCLRIKQGVMAQKLATVEAKWPADWWQSVKDRFAPRWFLRRWPVEYEQCRLEAKALYPKIALPAQEHYMHLAITPGAFL